MAVLVITEIVIREIFETVSYQKEDVGSKMILSRMAILVTALSMLGACGGQATDSADPEVTTAQPKAPTPTSVADSVSTSPASTTSPTSTSLVPDPLPETALYNFAESDTLIGWVNQNDTVMGGLSDSSSLWSDGRMIFSGNLSLDNNGGFTSTFGPVSQDLADRLSGASALVVRARGDGKTFLLQLRGNDNTRYIQRFTTSIGDEQDYILLLADFVAVDWRLSIVGDAPVMNKQNMVQMGFYLLDKQTGPFELAISSISVIDSTPAS